MSRYEDQIANIKSILDIEIAVPIRQYVNGMWETVAEEVRVTDLGHQFDEEYDAKAEANENTYTREGFYLWKFLRLRDALDRIIYPPEER
jgi:hypothetical protein